MHVHSACTSEGAESVHAGGALQARKPGSPCTSACLRQRGKGLCRHVLVPPAGRSSEQWHALALLRRARGGCCWAYQRRAAASDALLHCLPATAHKKQRGASCRAAAALVYFTFRAVVLRVRASCMAPQPCGVFPGSACGAPSFHATGVHAARLFMAWCTCVSSHTHPSVHFLQIFLSSAPVAYKPGGLGFWAATQHWSATTRQHHSTFCMSSTAAPLSAVMYLLVTSSVSGVLLLGHVHLAFSDSRGLGCSVNPKCMPPLYRLCLRGSTATVHASSLTTA